MEVLITLVPLKPSTILVNITSLAAPRPLFWEWQEKFPRPNAKGKKAVWAARLKHHVPEILINMNAVI